MKTYFCRVLKNNEGKIVFKLQEILEKDIPSLESFYGDYIWYAVVKAETPEEAIASCVLNAVNAVVVEEKVVEPEIKENKVKPLKMKKEVVVEEKVSDWLIF